MNILILGNKAIGKTTIAEGYAYQLRTSLNLKVEVIDSTTFYTREAIRRFCAVADVVILCANGDDPLKEGPWGEIAFDKVITVIPGPVSPVSKRTNDGAASFLSLDVLAELLRIEVTPRLRKGFSDWLTLDKTLEVDDWCSDYFFDLAALFCTHRLLNDSELSTVLLLHSTFPALRDSTLRKLELLTDRDIARAACLKITKHPDGWEFLTKTARVFAPTPSFAGGNPYHAGRSFSDLIVGGIRLVELDARILARARNLHLVA